MKKLVVPAIFAILVLVYFRNTIFANALISRHQGTDLYSYFLMAKDQLAHFQIGNFWVARGGGYSATALNQLVVPSNLLLMGLYSITHNFLTVLRIFDPLIYFCTLCATYWYGLTIFKGKKSLSVIVAVTFTFCAYGFSQLEHLDLLTAPIFIVLCLGFFERILTNSKGKYIILTALFAFLTYLTHLYAFFFLLMFMLIRFIWEICVNKERRRVMLDTLKAAIITLVAAIPFLSIQLTQAPSSAVRETALVGLQSYSVPSGEFFLRSLMSGSESGMVYLGISVFVLALLPIILNKTNRVYVFFLVTTVILLFYASGFGSPINIAQFVHNYVPFAYFIRVPTRVIMTAGLTLAVCATFGVGALLELVKKRWLQHALVGCIIVLIFCDLTLGFSPTPLTQVLTDNQAYTYVSQQPGDFRVLEIPSIHGQLAMTDMYTNHDVSSSIEWAYGYDNTLSAMANLSSEYASGNINAAQTAFYGIKYVIINLTPSYFAQLATEIKDVQGPSEEQVATINNTLSKSSEYKLVFSQDSWCIYEDLDYAGLVTGNVLSYTYSPNKLTITGSGVVQISQSFNSGWKASVGILINNNSMTQVVLPSTTTTTTLTYTPYKKSLLLFLVYIPLVVVVVLLRKKK